MSPERDGSSAGSAALHDSARAALAFRVRALARSKELDNSGDHVTTATRQHEVAEPVLTTSRGEENPGKRDQHTAESKPDDHNSGAIGATTGERRPGHGLQSSVELIAYPS